MSATSFRAADLGLGPVFEEAPAESPEVRRRRVTRPWALTADLSLAFVGVVALGLMARHPEWATIPYHLLFLSVMLVYGFRVWPLPVAALVVVVITTTTGLLIVNEYLDGVVDGPELAEIPLMPALLVAMVWHARRRVAANEALVRMAAKQQTMLERERTFFRDTSHAIRTPVTIARGHLELASDAGVDAEVRADMDVALRQLDRMSLLSNRLLALAQLDAGQTPPAEELDLSTFVLELGDNWSVRSRRNWVVSCPDSATLHADPVWLALAVDALVENAVHFTVDGGTISFTG